MTEVELFDEALRIVKAVRQIRARNKVPKNKELKIKVRCNEELAAFLYLNPRILKVLANASYE